MATKFRLRRSATADKRPVESDLLLGELALNTYDGRLYTKRDTNNVGIADTAALLTPWTENFGGGSIHYGNSVGIGTTNIDSNTKLHIKDTTVNQIKQETTASNGYSISKFVTSSGDGVKDKYIIGYNDGHSVQPDQLSLKNQTGDITFMAGGVAASDEKLRITSAGLVGINSTSPSSGEKLVIRGGASDSSKFAFHTYADFLGGTDAWQGYTAIFRGANAATPNSQWLGIGATTANGWISFADNSDSKITITSSGVGIGDETPSYMLDVSGAINSQTDVKVGGVSVSETALNDAVAMAIALG